MRPSQNASLGAARLAGLLSLAGLSRRLSKKRIQNCSLPLLSRWNLDRGVPAPLPFRLHLPRNLRTKLAATGHAHEPPWHFDARVGAAAALHFSFWLAGRRRLEADG